jgi:hypothetical protein
VIEHNFAADELSFTTSHDSNGLSTKDERTKRGRPIGTTYQAKHDRVKKRVKCVNDIVRLYQEEKTKQSNDGKRTSKGFLNNLISAKWQEYDLHEYKDTQSEVSPCTIHSRLNKCTDPYAAHRGLQPPTGHKLVTKQGERFASDLADWSKEIYIRQMYDVIYDNMVEAGVAIVLDHPMVMDKDGIEAQNKEDMLGLPCNIKKTILITYFSSTKQVVTQIKRKMAILVLENMW